MAFTDTISQLAELRVEGRNLVLLAILIMGGRYGHQAPQTEIRILQNSRRERRDVRQGATMFALLVFGVAFDPDREGGLAAFLGRARDLLRMPSVADGLDFAANTDDFADFIGLQVTDVNPIDRQVSPNAICPRRKSSRRAGASWPLVTTRRSTFWFGWVSLWIWLSTWR